MQNVQRTTTELLQQNEPPSIIGLQSYRVLVPI